MPNPSFETSYGTHNHEANDMQLDTNSKMSWPIDKRCGECKLFNKNILEKLKPHIGFDDDMKMAIERDELSPRFQPVVVAESGRIVGAELLLRWIPSKGEVSPAVFIPIAEETGDIVPIGAWVFRQACLAEADWRIRWGKNAPYISLNVSARQLDEETLVDDFALALRESGADPTRMILEITETALMSNVETNLRILKKLADLGLRVAVDDFGTGYSSLAQLTRMPVDVLKIDKTFIDQIETSSESRAVVRSVIGLGRTLGMQIVAEGVENGAQQVELCSLGCDFIQGYHFHRPLKSNEFIEVMERDLHGSTNKTVASLHFLIYVSKAVEPMSKQALDTLLKQSQTFNRSKGITGYLLYQDGYFMQMLEGNRDILFDLMDKVKIDPRHHDVRIVIEERTRCRVFLDWSMALSDLTPKPNEPKFNDWQRRRISFFELAEDARTCFTFITAYARFGIDH